MTGPEIPPPRTEPQVSEPRPVSELDLKLTSAIQGVHRARWITIIVALVVLTAACITLGVIVWQQQRELRATYDELNASCGWYAEVSVLPVMPAAPTGKPTRVAVQLIASSRIAYYGQGCGGRLAPNPSLKQWAAYYHVRYLP